MRFWILSKKNSLSKSIKYGRHFSGSCIIIKYHQVIYNKTIKYVFDFYIDYIKLSLWRATFDKINVNLYLFSLCFR